MPSESRQQLNKTIEQSNLTDVEKQAAKRIFDHTEEDLQTELVELFTTDPALLKTIIELHNEKKAAFIAKDNAVLTQILEKEMTLLKSL
jgi:hypothetical protein